jgi:hypothetical protein
VATNHFNRLTEAEQERLAILIEEAGEIVQSGCKILRHGYESTNPVTGAEETNREALQREIGDLGHAVRRMIDEADLDSVIIEERTLSKPERIRPYLHHQPSPLTDEKRDELSAGKSARLETLNSSDLRPASEIKRAHDMLVPIMLGEAPPIFSEADRESIHIALDVLCWALRHDHNTGFAENIQRIEVKLHAAGVVLRDSGKLQVRR